ncbi:two-component sensor histidine kinase BarA [Rheinheimera aquimaris]|jgi:two-component system sensor histidine kinase BarA|uniref:two-component sensor histidine kinase BarA n=1 Tax=Rheinheimera aquimaris TaxID=412437 RepID=UPI000E7D627C|nr:two-component sensor histidine kinase BarA [Rheinheimera aquimaris]HBN89050.1 two-component sensor histidine kinase BarA [Rheinheimera sp.]|tara:strand:+ start:2870 stop:5584 length:2715 start_codon:yes stop_codon:yes gene_type:complete
MTKIGLRSWLLLCSLLPALLVSVFCAGYFSYVRYQELALSFSQRAQHIALPLSISSQDLLSRQNTAALEQLLSSAHRLNSPLVSNISLFDTNHQPLIHTNPQQFSRALQLSSTQKLAPTGLLAENVNELVFYQPLPTTDDSGIQGYLLLQLPKAQLQLQQQQLLLHVILITVGCLLAFMLPTLLLLRRVHQPVRQILRNLQLLLNGQKAETGSGNTGGIVRELTQLQHSLNLLGTHFNVQEQEMQQQIEQVTSDLQQSMEQLEVQNIELDFARRKAQEENRQKSEFLAKMSHELRTPLNGVIGFTRQLLKTQLSSNQHDYLTTIQKSANSLLHLVNDVLDFSKLEEGRLSINPEPFSLRDMLNDATELLAANAFDKHLELVLMVEPSCPDDLVADPARFVQVLMNIAGNAIKFTDHGSIVIRVSATLLNEDQLILHCSVQDTGRGISEEQQSQLFQGFSYNDSRSHQSGSGLGLMISQRLVKAMGGNIGFESKQAEGSTFWFTIKCLRHHIAVADSLPLDVLENKHLLYFEPQQHSREATLALLHNWGLQVTACATKGQLQQALAHQQHYDIGLIGRTIALNQVNQVLALIKQIKPQCSHTCLLVNTLSPHLRETLLSSGADACLSKPPHLRKLATALAQPYLKKAQPVDETAGQRQGSLKVLTVDDNEANLKLINTLLAEQVEQIDSARDGAEAWHKATQHVYDIIFMDINMPVMDGINACQRIRQSSLNEHTPIIAVTAHAVDGERARLLTLGFNEFLSKPLDENMLHCSLQEFCPTSRPQSPPPNWPASKLVNWPMSLERAGGKCSLMKEMLQMLVSSIPPSRAAIQQAVTSQDVTQLLQQIHKLNGACCYTGVPRLKQLSELLETQLKQGKSLTELEPELLELDDIMQWLWLESQHWQWQ